ncbi:MAG: hypothetical protein KatS3mg129_1796 [Leptospiraceae bacterium]|nr:MAG: hypothetical protein KatS3mg129_1796 [Leptospiraceae bacterium]
MILDFKKFIIYFIYLLICSQSINANDFIHIYFFNPQKNHLNYLEKYYNELYKNKKFIHNKSKEYSIFFINFFPKKENNNKDYFYILDKFYFDYINFIDKSFTDEEKNLIKKYKEKLLCFNCSEKNSFLYHKYIFVYFKQIKIGIIQYKNCKIDYETLKKILYLHEDTNLWIFALNNNECDLEIFKNFYNDKNIFIIFIKNNHNEFYKKYKNIYYCHIFNEICYIRLKFREGEILNLKNHFVNIENFYE